MGILGNAMPIDEFSRIDEEYFETVLDDDFCFEGTAKFGDSLMVKGQLKGCLESSDLVVVGPNAAINAKIASKQLQCYGKIVGDVTNLEDTTFHAPSTITGDITTKTLSVETGCRINGKITMKDEEETVKKDKLNIK